MTKEITNQDKQTMKNFVYVKFRCDPNFGPDIIKDLVGFLKRNFPEYEESQLKTVVNEMPMELNMIRRYTGGWLNYK
jgi:hypothetical protein